MNLSTAPHSLPSPVAPSSATARWMTIAVLLCTAWLAAPAVAQDSPPTTDTLDTPMVFEARQACSEKGCRTDILATGTIVAGSGRALGLALEGQDLSGGAVVFDSRGGLLRESLLMGMLIRTAGLNTRVDAEQECFSACVYAFMGGVGRELHAQALLGVHQFHSAETNENAIQESQQVSALLADYTVGMGASTELMVIAAKTRPTELTMLDRSLAQDLRVDNTFSPLQPWVIEAKQEGLRLVLNQQSLGNDRFARIGLRTVSRRQAVVDVVFQNPVFFSRTRSQGELDAPPTLVICRVSSDLKPLKDRCLISAASVSWQPSASRRLYATQFEIELADLTRVASGGPDDLLVVSIGRFTDNSPPSLTLMSKSEGFERALSALH